MHSTEDKKRGESRAHNLDRGMLASLWPHTKGTITDSFAASVPPGAMWGIEPHGVAARCGKIPLGHPQANRGTGTPTT